MQTMIETTGNREQALSLNKAFKGVGLGQGVTKRFRLSWLTNSSLAVVYEPKCGEWLGCGVSVNV
jgi:hypothetical protein